MNPAPESLCALTDRFDPEAFDAPGGRARVRLTVEGEGEWDAVIHGAAISLRDPRGEPDATIRASANAWTRVASDLAGGLAEHESGRLAVRKNLHIGVGFLAAVSARRADGRRLRFDRVKTRHGTVAIQEAGAGPPVLMLHGLGGTKISFLPTQAALAGDFRTIAVDLPGFGDSDKPLPAAYDAPFFAKWVVALMDELEIDHAHVIGHSMGGRVAIELGMAHADRIDCLTLMTPSLAWLRDKRWTTYLKLVRPELAVLQPAPRPVVERFVRAAVPGAKDGWSAAGIDEFLRAYLTPRGRVAFYAAARNIYLEEGDAFWSRLEAVEARSLFLWGRRDQLIPMGFSRHVRKALPAAEHVVLDCGHIPQFERPAQAHAAISRFLRGVPAHGGRTRSRGTRAARRTTSGLG
ncbi:MAG TPA: alpha/beta fold hydrolase [Thermoleophilaceae bacterium]